MRRMTASGRFYASRKHIKSVIKSASNPKYKIKSPEAMLSKLIPVEAHNLNRISNLNIIYNLLIQIKYFKEFMTLNELNKDVILNVLNKGILKTFALEEKIHKKGKYPKFYFLILVGSVSYYYHSELYPGMFFGDEIIGDIPYKNTAFASEENTILLLIPKELFNLNLRDNMIKTKSKIVKLLTDSFHIFKTFDVSMFNKYKRKMIKIFPKTRQSVISKDEIAKAIFIIFKGSCSLNIEETQDLIILEKGNIFGIESLNNIDEKGNIMKKKYLYNIINIAPNTIILKFFIKDLNQMIINSLKNQLTSYLFETKKIVQKHESMRENLKNKLMENYKRIMKKKNLEMAFSKSMFIDLSPKKTGKHYNMALNKMQFGQENFNDKQKLIHETKSLFKKKQNKRNNLLQKRVKSKNFISSKESSVNSNTRNKIMKNILLKKDMKKIKNIILNSDLIKKINDNKKSDVKEDIKKNLIIPNKNRKNFRTIDFNNSSKNLIQDYSNNNSFFFNSISGRKNIKDKEDINILNTKLRTKKYQKKMSRRIKGEEISKNKNEGSKTIIESTYRDSISYRNRSYIISEKKQIEDYGCTALNSMNYFNHGEKENSLNANNSDSNPKKINFKKFIFYETNKYNIPLFVLCDDKEKIKFPQLINF